MEIRQVKQLIFGSIYAILFIFLVAPLWFFVFKPTPTCFDKTQNQNEEGIDCGGVCQKICLPPDLQPLDEVEQVRIFVPAKDRLTILARIKNPNPEHGARFSYTLTIKNDAGESLLSIPGSGVISPSQLRYLVIPGIDFPNPLQATKAELQFTRVDWQPGYNFQIPNLTVRDQAVKRTENFLEIGGTLVNDDLYEIPQVSVVGIFYNQWKVPVGAGETTVQNLRSGETRQFTVIHPYLRNVIPEGSAQVFVFSE